MKLHVLTPATAAVDRVRCHLLNWIGYWPNMVEDPSKGYKLIRDLHSENYCVIEFNLADWGQRSSWDLKDIITRGGWKTLSHVSWLRVYWPDDLVMLRSDEIPTKPGIYVSASDNTAGRSSKPDRIINLYGSAVSEPPEPDITTHIGLCDLAYRTAVAHAVHLPESGEKNDWITATRKLCHMITTLEWPNRDIYLYTVEGNPLFVNGEPTDIYAYYTALYLLLDWYSNTRGGFDVAKFMRVVARQNQNRHWVTLHQVKELFRMNTMLLVELCNIIHAGNGHAD